MLLKDSILVDALESAFVCGKCGRLTGLKVYGRRVVFRCLCGFEVEFTWSKEYDAVVLEVLKNRV